MSQRTLLELNHDHTALIENNPDLFIKMVLAVMRDAQEGEHLPSGLTYHGTRHHSESFRIQWGSYESYQSKER